MRAALKQKRSKNRARQKVVKSSERLSIALLPGRHNRSLAKQSVGSARVFSATFCILGKDSDLSGKLSERRRNFCFWDLTASCNKAKSYSKLFQVVNRQIVKKIIKKNKMKLTDIDKASRCALAELSRLVRKADFNNSWGGKKWCKKQIWILTNLTRDMSRWGLYADCMICDQLTPDGDCSENNLNKWMETKKTRKLLTTTWRPSKKFSPMMTMVCPPDVQPSDGERALTCGKKMKTWRKKSAKSKKRYMWVVKKLWGAMQCIVSLPLTFWER